MKKSSTKKTKNKKDSMLGKVVKSKLALFAAVFAVVGVTTLVLTSAAPPYDPIAGCAEGDAPLMGQASPSPELEPQGAIWCFDLQEPPAPTRISRDNSWVDEFTLNELMVSFEDTDLDYRVYDDAGARPSSRSGHFINNNHWMLDTRGTETGAGGSSIRPNRSFQFEDGKFVIEADFAAGIPEYEGHAWGELNITTAAEPGVASEGGIDDGLYSYGQFANDHAVGCRLHFDGNVKCAVMGDEVDVVPGDCFANVNRMIEVSWFQDCGNESVGGLRSASPDPAYPNNTGGDFWRLCESNQMDLFCRDRFRMEVTQDSLTLYVNGYKYFESTGWPEHRQLPDSFINGDIYAYQSSWGNRTRIDTLDEDELIRFHWDHFAVNPIGGLTSAPSFCLGEPNSTCPVPTSFDPEPQGVDIYDFGFTEDITIRAGETVNWQNVSALGIAHTVTSDTGLFDSGIVGPGETYAYTFDTPGEFPYHCIPHPNMTGTITVLPADGDPPDPEAADLNGDGNVNIFDLSMLLGRWNDSGSGVVGDINDDGTVNIFDLSILLGRWDQ